MSSIEDDRKAKIRRIRKATGSLLITAVANLTIPIVMLLWEELPIIWAVYASIIWGAFVIWFTQIIMETLGFQTKAEKAKAKEVIAMHMESSKDDTKELIQDATHTIRETKATVAEMDAEVTEMKKAIDEEPVVITKTEESKPSDGTVEATENGTNNGTTTDATKNGNYDIVIPQ